MREIGSIPDHETIEKSGHSSTWFDKIAKSSINITLNYKNQDLLIYELVQFARPNKFT